MKEKIYIASKARHRKVWRSYRDELGLNIISRWIDTDDKYIDTTYGDEECLDYVELWYQCLEDVLACDTLICYVEPGEVLKGALVEVGAALATGKKVICVGSMNDFLANGTWIFHPKVERVRRLSEFSDLMQSFLYV